MKAQKQKSPDRTRSPILLALTGAPVKILQTAAGSDEPASTPRFEGIAYTGAAMRVGSWSNPVVIDLDGLLIERQDIPVRHSHREAEGVGHCTSVAVVAGELRASGLISRDTPQAAEIIASSAKGFPWRMSVTMIVSATEELGNGQTTTVNGRNVKGPLTIMRSGVLNEISFVDMAADPETSVSVAAKQEEERTQMKRTSTVVDCQSDAVDEDVNHAGVPSSMDAVAVEGEQAAETGCGQVTTSLRAAATDELARVNAVSAMADGFPEIQARAIAEGWSNSQTAMEVVRAGRPRAPATHVPDSSINRGILEAAICIHGHLPEQSIEAAYGAPVMDQAIKRYPHGMGIRELLCEAAHANGFTGQWRDIRGIFEHAFRRSLQASMSSIDIGGILSAVANKFLLAGFLNVETTWREITAIVPVSNLLEHKSYRLTGNSMYEEVGPGGELTNGTLGEREYANRAKVHGLILNVSYEDIVNDDLGAITRVPQNLGRGSALAINKAFWTAFLDNAAFFTAGDANFFDGSGTALSIDGLTAAELAFYSLTDPDGNPLGTMPKLLLVPPALMSTAQTLFTAQEVRNTTATTKYPTANPHAGKYRVVVSAYIGAPAFAGSSTKAWYLLADPADLAVMQVAFLDGRESPTIETADADFSVLGIRMRGYHSFGAAKMERRGGVKMKGEA